MYPRQLLQAILRLPPIVTAPVDSDYSEALLQVPPVQVNVVPGDDGPRVGGVSGSTIPKECLSPYRHPWRESWIPVRIGRPAWDVLAFGTDYQRHLGGLSIAFAGR
jgi:hypothetical protein